MIPRTQAKCQAKYGSCVPWWCPVISEVTYPPTLPGQQKWCMYVQVAELTGDRTM